MSVETSRTSQPGDGEPDDEQHRFAFRSADSGADGADLDDDLGEDDDVTSGDAEDDDLDDDDDTVVRGTVVDDDVTNAGVTDPGAVADADDLQPTFTPATDSSAHSAWTDSEPVDDTAVDGSAFDNSVDPTAPTLSETDDVPVVPAPVTDTSLTETPAAETPLASPAAVDLNEPLLGDTVGLRASWQQAQAGFVDDPRAAVADAAELVEHTAQTLIGALQQRQQQLRTQWDNNGSGAASATDVSDTEQLRHLMQDYRSLFNQLCTP